jgi:eukaryotic-like serine/threonine-protein kinase
MLASVLVVLAVLGGVAATVREARIAAANARRAERRFNDVRKLANSFLFEFHDAIEHLQGSTPARELVVKRALEYLDSLSAEAGSDLSLRHDLATAYEKVGNVQGSPYRDNLGDTKGALVSFRKAVTLREQLVQASPQDQDLRGELARDYGEIGDVFSASGDLKAAMDSYRKGLAVLASDLHPNMKTQIRMEILCDRYGRGLAESGDPAHAVESFQRALLVLDELIKEDPAERENVRDKAVTNIHLATSYMQMRRLPEALAANRAAQALLQSLVDPTNAQSQRDVTVANQGIAMVLEKMGDKRGALTIYLNGLAQDQASAKTDPSDALLRRDLYIDYEKVASARSALGEMQEALLNQHKAAALNEAEAAANPASAMTRKDLQTEYFRLGEILRKTKQNGEAERYFEKARVLAEELSKADPKDTEIQADLSSTLMNRSDVQLALGKESSALAGYQQALSIAEPLVASNPANSEWEILLAQLDQKVGEYYAKGTGPARCDQVLGWYHKSEDLWKDLQQRNALGDDYAKGPAEVARDIAGCEADGVAHH